MYSFFHPENNQRLSNSKEHEFETIEEAIDYWKDRRTIWDDITVPGKEPAFMQPHTGEVIVIREI